MTTIKDQKNRYIYSVILSLIIILVIIFAVSFFSKNNKDSNFTRSTNNFPLYTDENSSNFYSFNCIVNNIKIENTEYRFGTNENDYISIRLTSECNYLDAKNKQQTANVVMAAISQKDSYFFIAYGNRSNSSPRNPEEFPGERLKKLIELNYDMDNNKDLNQSNLGENDIIRITMAKSNNKFVEDGIESNLSGMSERVFAGSGFTKSWDSDAQEMFFETGDIKYLPTLPDGRSIIPAIRVSFIEDN